MTTHKNTPEITEAERVELLEAAAKMAQDWSTIGAGCDVEGRFPVETVEAYKASPIASMAVPRRWGGLGADLLTVGLVGRELAKGDASIALAYNMHQAMVGGFRNTSQISEATREHIMRAVAEDRKLICGPFSEARAGLSGLADTVAVPDGNGGWRLSGQKNWSTLVEGSDLIALNATITDADGQLPDDFRERAERESLFVIPTNDPDVHVLRTWDTMGMRSTGSHTIDLRAAHAGPDTYFGNFRNTLSGESEWAAVLFAGVYLGLADRAYEEARAILRTKHLGATMSANDTAMSQVGYVQHELGRMFYAITTAERVLESTGRIAIEQRDRDWPPSGRKPRWDIAKVACTEAALTVTDLALRLVGGSAFRRGHILERLRRDAHGGYLHSLGTNQLYSFLGQHELGLI